MLSKWAVISLLGIGGLLLIACGPGPIPIPEMELPFITIEGERVSGFTAVADTTIVASGLNLEPAAEARLKELIAQGELKLMLAPERQAEATASLAFLLAAIIEDTRIRGDSSISLFSVERALGICPIWPFC